MTLAEWIVETGGQVQEVSERGVAVFGHHSGQEGYAALWDLEDYEVVLAYCHTVWLVRRESSGKPGHVDFSPHS